MERLEVELRREAARRRLAGESPRAIGRDLGRTRRWVAKWAARYDPHDPCWAEGRSRAPKRVASRTDAGVEAVVLEIRSRLERIRGRRSARLRLHGSLRSSALPCRPSARSRRS